MFNESDKEQIEQLKKLWREYGRSLIVAIVIGLACGYGWQYWQKYQHAQNQQAVFLFHEASNQSDKKKQAEALNELTSNYERSPYSALAKMAQANEFIKQEHYGEALDSLKWVQNHAKSKSLQDLAKVRSARVLLVLHHPQQALDLLSELHDSVYQAMVYELEGDAYAALGNVKQAKKAYKKAQKAYAESGSKNLLIDRKVSSPVRVPN